MNDSEARGLVLRKIYEHKDEGTYVSLDQLGQDFEAIAMDRYLAQLEDLNLIRRKPLRGPQLVADMIQMTAYGINSIEHPETAPSQIVLNIQRSDVQIGDRNVQNIRVGVGTVQAPMVDSQAMRTAPRGESLVTTLLRLVKSWFSRG